LRPSLSIDVVTTVPGDMFTEMRAAFGAERARVNAVCWEANTDVPDTMLTARDLNMVPVKDPVAAVTLSADVSNVDTVIVDGVVRKRGGKLLADVDRARRLVEASCEYLENAAREHKA